MTTLLYHHPICAEHDTSAGHPERPERLRAILDALKGPDFAALEWREAPEATVEQLARVHPGAYVERVLGAIPQQGYHFFDMDTIVSPRSGDAALRAAGAVCAAVDAVMAGEAQNAFCAVRPPGHHAEPDRTMGFCLFNNVAVGAAQARFSHGVNRVAVVDFDVHHGNGTQAAFWDQPACLYLSTHQSPLYPGTGRSSEHGTAANVVNVPLAPYSGSEELRAAWSEELEPVLRRFRPEFIFVSAGFDGHWSDPLAQLEFTEDDYAWITERIVEVAAACCRGRVVTVLEGGYDLAALAASAMAHVKALMAA